MPERIINLNDEAVQSSIAEMNLSEQLQKILSTVDAEAKRLGEIIGSLNEGKFELVKKGYESVKQLKDEAQNLKEGTMEYIVRVSPALLTKELYIYSLSHLDRLIQIMDSIAYRLTILAESGIELDGGAKERFIEMSRKSLNMISELFQEAKMLSTNAKMILEVHEDINSKEEEVDQLYRGLVLEIIKKYSKDVFSLMILKEIVDLTEDLADIIREASHDFKYLALYKL
ncbi:MAG: DUF47 domain-containing protein [Fervidicoccaceae archaeon]|jgi:uncharacterized protein Yka (UPF0111/DUF47 family)